MGADLSALNLFDQEGAGSLGVPMRARPALNEALHEADQGGSRLALTAASDAPNRAATTAALDEVFSELVDWASDELLHAAFSGLTTRWHGG